MWTLRRYCQYEKERDAPLFAGNLVRQAFGLAPQDRLPNHCPGKRGEHRACN